MWSSKTGVCLWVGLALLLFVGPVLARNVTVNLKDGNVVSGELIEETDATITVRLPDGGERRLPRGRISDVQETITVKEEYIAKKQRIAADDHEGRYEIALWLFRTNKPEQRQELLRLAQAELKSALTIKSDYAAASALLAAVEAELPKKSDEPDPTNPDAEDDEPALPLRPAFTGGTALLEEVEINQLKALELILDDRPTVVVPPKVADEFLAAYTRDPIDEAMRPYVGRKGERAFKTLEGYQQLGVMFDVRARDFYSRVIVRDEPASLQEFRQRVNPTYLTRYCGRCHGEGRAEGYHVVRRRAGTEQTAYTNLVVLSLTRIGDLPLLTKDQPARSPFLQLGLPPEESAMPHPDVKGWKPYFRGRTDPKFTQIVAWIETLYTDPANMLPDYPEPLPAFGR